MHSLRLLALLGSIFLAACGDGGSDSPPVVTGATLKISSVQQPGTVNPANTGNFMRGTTVDITLPRGVSVKPLNGGVNVDPSDYATPAFYTGIGAQTSVLYFTPVSGNAELRYLVSAIAGFPLGEIVTFYLDVAPNRQVAASDFVISSCSVTSNTEPPNVINDVACKAEVTFTYN